MVKVVSPVGASAAQPAERLTHGLSWSAIGGVGAGAVLFAQNIVAGRLLGPTEYGLFALVQSLSMVLLITFLAGFDLSSSRALARTGDPTDHRTIVSSSVAAVLVCTTGSALILLAFGSLTASVFDTQERVVRLTVLFTALLAQRWLAERQLSGLGLFRQQAAVRLAEAGVIVATFAVLVVVFGQRGYESLVMAYCAGATVFVGGGYLISHARPRYQDVRVSQVRRLLLYSGLMNGSYVVTTLLFQVDRLAVNRTLGVRDLGIYTAYYAATLFIVIQVLLIVSNVLFPRMAQTPDKRDVVHRLDKYAPVAVLAGFLMMILSSVIVLSLFGSEYPFDLALAASFAGWAALYGCNGIYAVIVNAHNARAAARELAFQPFRFALLLLWFVVLAELGRITLVTSVIGLLVVEVLETVNLRFVLRRYVTKTPQEAV